MNNFNKVLVIGAHYDDSELGVGGTSAKLLKMNREVYKITMTDTVVKSEDMNIDITSDRVKINSADACKTLGGVEELDFPTAPYGNLKYTQKVMQELEHLIFSKSIDTVFFHYEDDYNTDHMAAHKICKTAARHARNLLMFQSNPYITFEQFCPNYFVDISDTVELKKKALDCYDSEHDRWGHLFSANVQRNGIWGYGNHVEYAEGFAVIKMMG